VLLADVARAHASVPAGSDAGLILSAASQIQVSQGGEAISVLRRTDMPAQGARLERFVSKFAGWSKHLTGLGNPVVSGPVAFAMDSSPESSSSAIPHDQFSIVSLAVFAHTGSPAP